MTRAAPTLLKRSSDSRGHAHHGWLRSFHTFSFADYYSPDPLHQHFGPLRVINEDRVDPSQGFPRHSHREAEIFSYVVDGTIAHQDSMGGNEKLKRGGVQMTSAGTGISHSEFNGGKFREPLHFLQIWALPNQRGLTPTYYTREFTDEEKRDALVKIVAPSTEKGVNPAREAAGAAPIHSNLSVYASILSPSASVSHTFERNKGYLHLIMRSGYVKPGQAPPEGAAKVKVTLGDKTTELTEGDGVYLDHVLGETVTFESTASGTDAEFVLFDLADQ